MLLLDACRQVVKLIDSSGNVLDVRHEIRPSLARWVAVNQVFFSESPLCVAVLRYLDIPINLNYLTTFQKRGAIMIPKTAKQSFFLLSTSH